MRLPDLEYWWYRTSWALGYKDVAGEIPVGSLLPSKRERAVSIPKVVAALRRIAQGDPHRFQRIPRQVRCIQLMGTKLYALGSWYGPLAMIFLSHDWLESDSSSVERVALTIVHEATPLVFLDSAMRQRFEPGSNRFASTRKACLHLASAPRAS